MPLYSQQFNRTPPPDKAKVSRDALAWFGATDPPAHVLAGRTPPPERAEAVFSGDGPSTQFLWEWMNQLVDDCNRLAVRVALLEAELASQREVPDRT